MKLLCVFVEEVLVGVHYRDDFHIGTPRCSTGGHECAAMQEAQDMPMRQSDDRQP